MARTIKAGESTLPPAGYKRTEELSRRKDQLEQKAEELSEQRDTFGVDPAKMEPDMELQEKIEDSLAVSNPDPAYMYVWVNYTQQMRFIKTYRSQGYEIVQGDDTAASELKGEGADTTRRLGDCILMKIRKDRYLILQRKLKKKREDVQKSVDSGLRLAGEQARRHGAVIHTAENLDPKLLKRMQTQALAAQMAEKALGDEIRSGTVPGMEI